jgi:prophage DNA circulation protein
MAWKDNLRPASFRGVPFRVDISQYTGGRRVALHEFPDRDDAFPEDLGGVGQSFRVDGHLLGDDYFEQKALLRAALEKQGSGELIHPYFGTLLVQIGPVSFDEDVREGRFVKVSFQCYKVPSSVYPKPINDKASILGDKAGGAMEAAKSKFDSVFSVAKLPGFAVDTARNGVSKVSTLFSDATKGVRTNADAIADLAYGIRNLQAEVNDLLQQPAKLSQRLMDSFALLEDAVGAPRGRLQAYSKFFGYAGDPILGAITPTRTAERRNQDAYDAFIRQVAVANAANQVSEIEFESTEDALETREQLREEIEEILLTTDDDTVFAAFEDLQASVVDLLPDLDSDLPNLQTVQIQNPQPSLVVAYDLFESIEVEADLVARNNIRNPAFVPIDRELEVLNVESGV